MNLNPNTTNRRHDHKPHQSASARAEPLRLQSNQSLRPCPHSKHHTRLLKPILLATSRPPKSSFPLQMFTHAFSSPQVQPDRVLFYECDHRADELIGLKIDVSGKFTTDFELIFVQEAFKKSPRGSFLRARRDTAGRELKWALLSAANPKSAHRGHHTHRIRPPAPRSLLRRPPVILLSMAVPRRGFFTQSPRRQLNSAKTNTTTLMFSSKVTWL